MKTGTFAAIVTSICFALFTGPSARAQYTYTATNAFDSASDGSYFTLPNNTYTIINGGFGYGLWTTNGGTTGGGVYMDGNRGVPATNNFSFALYAGGNGSASPSNTGSGFALSRPLANPLPAGQFRLYSRFDLDGGNGLFDGFSLRTGNNTNNFATGQLLAFGLGGTTNTANQLTYTDAAGFHAIPASADARAPVWFWVIDFNAAAGTYTLTVTNYTGAFSFTTNGNLSAGATTVGSFVAVNQSSGSFQNMVFDQLTFTNAVSVAVTSVALSTNAVVQIPTAYGSTYQLQATPSLVPTNWTNVGSSQTGNGASLPFTDPGAATNSQRFYRIQVTKP